MKVIQKSPKRFSTWEQRKKREGEKWQPFIAFLQTSIYQSLKSGKGGGVGKTDGFVNLDHF